MNTAEIINLFCQSETSADGSGCSDCKPCRRCEFELKARDRFCRRCGWRQFDFVSTNTSRLETTTQHQQQF